MKDRTQPTGELQTRIELDLAIANGCGNPDCKEKHGPELYLTQNCCPGAGVQVRYDVRDHNLHVECRNCESPIADVKVADR